VAATSAATVVLLPLLPSLLLLLLLLLLGIFIEVTFLTSPSSFARAGNNVWPCCCICFPILVKFAVVHADGCQVSCATTEDHHRHRRTNQRLLLIILSLHLLHKVVKGLAAHTTRTADISMAIVVVSSPKN
jgi:hypothetical protein